MPIFQIGERQFDYTLRRSPSVKKANLTITPHSFELLVPEHATDEQIKAVLHRRRAWILATAQGMQQRAEAHNRVYNFITGAKVPYWGRMIRLTVEPYSGLMAEVNFRNGFIIKCPADLSSEDSNAEIESALRLWLKRRIRDEAKTVVKKYGLPNGLKPRGVQIKDQKHMWGSCGTDRQINLNWHLIFAPKPVFEYAVVHELCHLSIRNHEQEFWQLVGSILPDWEKKKAWLDQNEHLLGWERVRPMEV